MIDSDPAAPTLAPEPVAPEVEVAVKLSCGALPPLAPLLALGSPAVTLMLLPVMFAPEPM